MATLTISVLRDRFLTVGWNNALTLALGVPMVVLALIALTTSVFTELGGFVAVVIAGAFY